MTLMHELIIILVEISRVYIWKVKLCSL